jgi:hypothetical protein
VNLRARFNAQLLDQAERHNVQLVKQAVEFDWKLTDLTTKHNAQLAAKRAATTSEKP